MTAVQPRDMSEEEIREVVKDARVYLTTIVPFFSYLALSLKIVKAEPHHNVQKMGVSPDSYLYINPFFLSTLSREELIGVLCHEVMHLAMFFFGRLGSRDLRRFNRAHDYVINQMIVDFSRRACGELKLPHGALLDDCYNGLSAEEIYSLLPGTSLPSKDNGLFDCRPDLARTSEGKQAAAGSEGALQHLQEQWKQRVITAARRHEQKFGSLPGSAKKFIDELLEPTVNWVEALSRWVGENGPRSDYSFRRLGRRSYATQTLMRSIVSQGVDDVIVLWDTSGSMLGREKEIIPEMEKMCDDLNLSVRLLVCDTRVVADVKDCREAQDFITNYGGGGGSDFRQAFHRLEEDGAEGVVVVFTDGYIRVPDTKPPSLRDVLWVLWDAHNDVDPASGRWGSVLRVHTDGSSTWAAA